MDYYDTVLLGIGTLLITGGITAALTSPLVFLLFSLVAVGFVGHAMFFSPMAKRMNAPKREEPQSLN